MALYYLIDDDEDERYEEGQEDRMLENCIDSDYWIDDREGFDEYLNECYGTIDVCGYSFDTAEALYNLDENAYDAELCDWAHGQADNEWENAQYELRRAHDGSEIYVCNHTIYVYEEDEEASDYNGDEPFDEAVAELERERTKNLQVHVEVKLKEETEVHEENKRLEDEFMNLFQTIS